jgi:hypothetical protein
MIPYGFGFEPNEYEAMLVFSDEMRVLGRKCKTIAKKVGRRVRHKTGQ